jgi:phenylacetate-CoA ligase
MAGEGKMLRSLYTRLVSSVLFPLHERLKKHSTTAVRHKLEETQWYTPEQLDQWCVQRMRSFLIQAGEHVPYYRRLFADNGFDPYAYSAATDLACLPLLTKEAIRGNMDDLLADNAGPVSRFNTGGSSGEPLIFMLGKERVSHDVAAKWRATRWWGVDIGDPEIVVWGSPVELGAQDRVRALRDAVIRTELLPAFEMSPEMLDGFINTIRRRRPGMLFGYPSALSHIARHARIRKVRMDDLGIRVAFVTSERLYDEQRSLISDVFGCPVANGYGGRDAGFIAHQCPSGSMHITAEDILVEIVDPQGRQLPAGESGEIVVTHMATADFPFIRYRTGDVGVLDDKPCRCGRGLAVLREIQGRTTDFVVAMDGTVMHGLAVIYILRDIPGVESFKIIQESLHRCRILLVTADGFDPAVQEKIITGVRERLGEAVAVEIEIVDEIPAEASGKFRYVVSRVDPAARESPGS